MVNFLADANHLMNGIIIFAIGVICGGVATMLYRDVILGWFKGGRG